MQQRPRLLDLFCKAGGAGMGYHLAGFEVVGVDIEPQPHYPFTFIQADALTFPLEGYDVYHGSPVCKGYSVTRHLQGKDHPLQIAALRQRLQATGKPWVIENVVMTGEYRHEMPGAMVLCGTMFALKVYRHRYFESSHLLLAPAHPHHPRALMEGYVCIYGDVIRGRQTGHIGNQYPRYATAMGQAAMGIDWMTRAELAQAIPPAYTAHVGRQLLTAVV